MSPKFLFNLFPNKLELKLFKYHSLFYQFKNKIPVMNKINFLIFFGDIIQNSFTYTIYFNIN